LNWKTDSPVWVDQWPLEKTKLEALNALVEEQLQKGNIEPSNSPWNSPVFVIRKPGKDRWRLLHDLRKINEVIEDMGPLQPGMPSPTMLPQKWKLAVIDIRDCFFNIPLHPKDAPWFTFSVPSMNREAPMRRYHWRVLPQGMKNSPTICQWYVARILSPIRKVANKAIIYHYMDDLLICAPTQTYVNQTLEQVIQALKKEGFEIQSEKVQRVCPWKYLGLIISERTIKPQSVSINNNPRTLQELHQLCGTINWVRPLLGLTTEDLAPLFNLLRGDCELTAPRTLTDEAKRSIQKVEKAISTRQVHRYNDKLPFRFAIIGEMPYLHGLIFQWDEKDPLLLIEWFFLSHQPSKSITQPQELMAKLITKARVRLRTLAGCNFMCIYMLLNLDQLESLLQTNDNLQYALDSYTGQISIHYPKHSLLRLALKIIPKQIQSKKPLNALTLFTDGSGASCKSVITWLQDPQTQKWESDVEVVHGSPQVAELAAVVRAFERFKEPFNLITDSAYVAGVTARAEYAMLKEVSNPKIYSLLSKLVHLISHREQPYYVMHIRSHSALPG
ncbi:PO113 protein, partial [Ptilonorhynchus violaceus]|nr:PO113 protein [Ptilonorhynchus violaceus]